MTPPTAEFTNLLGRDTLKLAKTTLSGVSPFDLKISINLAAGHERLIMGIHSKQMDTEFAFTTQVIYLVLRESTWNPNTEKVCSIQEISA